MAIIKGNEGEHQHIYGAIDKGGNPLWGEGFTSRAIAVGLYVVEFKQPFRENPSVTCTIFGPEWETFNLSVAIVDLTPWYFVCTTSLPDNRQRSAFTFIAFGDI